MFSNLNKPAFGATAPSTSFGFGAAPAANANPFGQNQLFGKPTTGGFGSPSTSTFGQPTTNSLFPSTQAQPTNLFQNANTTFGAQPATQSGFGTTNLFAAQQPSAGGMFNAAASSFGQPAKPAGFGFGAQQPTLFGQPAQQQAQAQPQQAASIFQPGAAGGLFGSGGFGGQQQQQQAGTVVKFNPVTGTDTMMKGGLTQSINTKHHSITCMKEYENKSFEELRFEDYAANRKGPQQQTAGFGATPFGTPASSAPSLFGQPDASKAGFGQPTAGFGQATSAFGQTSTGFGMNAQQQQAGGGLFGKPTGLGTPISSTTNFGFGTNTQSANPFGSNQAKPFGSATPLFGANTTATTQQSAFGTTNMFGKPQDGTAQTFGTAGFRPAATGSSFAFAAPSATTQPQQTTSLFGQPAKPAFGQQQATPFAQSPFSANNAFGKPAQAVTGFGTAQPSVFGNTLGNSLMGNTANKPGLFSNTGSTGLFGNTNTGFQQNQSLSMQPQQQQQSFFPSADQNSTNWASFTTDPFGNAPHLAGLEPKLKTSPPSVSATDPKELKSLLDATKKVDTSRGSKLKVVPIKSVKDNLFDGLSPKANDEDTPTDYIKPNCRRLILKNRPPGEGNSPGIMRTDILKLIQSPGGENKNSKDEEKGEFNNSQSKIRTAPLVLSFDNSAKDRLNHSDVERSKSPSVPTATYADDDVAPEPASEPQAHAVSWTGTEYYTLPSMEELAKYVDESGSCLVKGFTIGRKGYGNVYFPDEIDISGLNVEEIVYFRYREINVYPDDTKKPPVGQGLNRRAQVTLDNVYPRRPGTNTLIKDTDELLQLNFAEKLRKVTENKNAKFVDYRPETGSWVFKVEHFSRYGFDDSDDEEQMSQVNGGQEAAKKKVASAAKLGVGLQGQKVSEELSQSAVQKNGLADKDGQMAKLVMDDDIEVDESDHFQGDDDLLQQSMYVDDMSEEDYHTIPTDVPMHLGYDLFETNKNIQVMKSTLFDDGMSDGGSSHVSIIRQYMDIPEDIPRLPVVREEAPTRRRRGVLRPKVEKVYNFAASEVSVGLIQNRSYMDMGIFNGKSFKAGWTKGFNFFSLNCKQGEVDGQLALNTIECSLPKNFDPLTDSLNESLEIVLEESSFTLDDNQIPTFRILKSNSYLEKQTRLFSNCLSKNNNKETRYLHSIWTLADALWGSHEETFSNRRHLLSEWLRTNTSFNDSSTSDPKNDIFDHLTVFRIKEAAELSLEKRCPNLSLIVSQLSVTNRTKIFLQEQIEGWYKSMAADHIGEDMKKIYLLLSGVPVKEINVFGDVDWKRAFGMHLWYISPAGAPLDVAIDLYRKAFDEQGYAQIPNPPYSTCYAEDGPFDVLYHVLLLYKTRIHRLSSVLNPATHTDDHLDYRLSWLLLQLFLSLEVGIIEDSEKTKLCTSFSNQLESLGEWEYAVFVLLYLEDNNVKKQLVLGVLDRNLSPEVDRAALESESRLVNRMHVPAEWVHEVKGNKTLLSQRYFEAFNHFAHCGDHGKANDILVRHLLPGLFINEQYDVIGALIEAIRDGARDISRWSCEAGLYSDFLELQERFISFKDDDVLRIQMALQSISDRMAFFPTDTDQQKVCVAEMSKRCATVYREVCEKCRAGAFGKTYSDFVEKLVMPPDFKQIEALNLVNRPECFGC